jgi:hypothetical protein
MGLSFIDSFTPSKDFAKEAQERVHQASERVYIISGYFDFFKGSLLIDMSLWIERNQKGTQKPHPPEFIPFEVF